MTNTEAVSQRIKGYRFFVSQGINSFLGKIDFFYGLWDNRRVKSENTRYKRGFHL